MNFVDPEFFDNKISIGVNRVGRKFNCTYLVAKDSKGFGEILEFRRNEELIVSKHEYGLPTHPLNSLPVDHWIFDHPGKLPGNAPDLSVVGTDKIVVSHSTITSAIHLAAFMGASNILICGHDCGAIDGQTVMSDYYSSGLRKQESEADYFSWLADVECQTKQVVGALKDVYGVRVHSLNPFINFNLEDHEFESSTRRAGDGELTNRVREKKLTLLEEELSDCQAKLNDIRNSASQKLGRVLTAPVRKLRDSFNGR